MIPPPDLSNLTIVPKVVLAVAVIVAVAWVAGKIVCYARTPKAQRPMLRKAWHIQRTWKRTAHRVGLVQVEKVHPRLWSSTPQTTLIDKHLIPSITTRVETWGVRVDVSTIARVGLAEFLRAMPHLADTWQVHSLHIEQPRPGRLVVRAMFTDPLTQPTQFDANPASLPVDPAVWVAGIDADGQPVHLRAVGVSGVVVAGLAGYGKTSFLNARFCQLARNAAVQFVLIDGKGGPDYDDLFARAWLWAKDQPDMVRDHLASVHALMTARQHNIRTVLGVKNMWHLGPSVGWPLVIVVIDEAHTFLNETKGNDPESRRLDALARETARLVEELIRKGRNVGIQVILATQKATGDAIPTRIRDNCQVAISFAQRTSEAATAVLGSDITAWPDEHPRRLQDPAYIGVSSAVTALATLHVGEAHAMLGNQHECQTALGQADEQLARTQPDDPAAALLCPTTPGRLAGSCYLYLGQPAKAEPILNATHQLLRQAKKSTAIVLGNLSLACIRQHHIDDATTYLHQAIDVLEQTRGGGGLNIAFTAARELRPWRDHSPVADVSDRLMALMTTA